MKTKIIPKLLSSLLALALCLPLVACQNEAPTDEVSGQAQESAHITDSMTESSQSTNGATASTDGAMLPDVELCWTCEELPAVDGSIYCVTAVA